MAKVYEPQQLGFHPNGCEIVPIVVVLMAVQLHWHLELHTSHVCVHLDNLKGTHFDEVARVPRGTLTLHMPPDLWNLN